MVIETSPLQRQWRKRAAPHGIKAHWCWTALARVFVLWYPAGMRTPCYKLAVATADSTALRQTQVAFNAAASYCATVVWEQWVTNKHKLHGLVSAASRRTYGLGAQLACCARNNRRGRPGGPIERSYHLPNLHCRRQHPPTSLSCPIRRFGVQIKAQAHAPVAVGS